MNLGMAVAGVPTANHCLCLLPQVLIYIDYIYWDSGNTVYDIAAGIYGYDQSGIATGDRRPRDHLWPSSGSMGGGGSWGLDPHFAHDVAF